MTTAATAIAAIIFIPPGHPLAGQFVMACMGHLVRRDYQLFRVLSDWDEVEAYLAAGVAQVVILATRTHRAGEVDRVEVVDEEQARILRQRNSAVGRRSVQAPTKRAVRGSRESVYETALLWPRGSDGGLAERFLNVRRGSRHTGDT